MSDPTITIVIPTLNSQQVLYTCLKSVIEQNYPKTKLEIIVVDGGSVDDTLSIAQKFNVKMINNPLRTGEAGKAIGLKNAKNELVAFIDSDNILPHKNWFKQMIEPLADKNIIGSEPWEYIYRTSDGFITRYSALLGMNDPLCLFLGNYDRKSILTGKWTGMPVLYKDIGRWLSVKLDGKNIPTIGANGTILRASFLKNYRQRDYLFDIDIIAEEAAKKSLFFAKVKTGIVHTFCESNIQKFWFKQTRRIQDYLYYKNLGVRRYNWQQNNLGILFFIVSTISLLPLILQSIVGFIKKPDLAWFFHPIACWITMIAYVYNMTLYFLGVPIVSTDRQNWRQ